MTELAGIIRDEINLQGVVSFARFMELALYHPRLGYYEQEQGRVGRAGDFYTSVSTGPLFGELLAFQFGEWLESLPAGTGPLCLVEAGAHDARLAADLLPALQRQRPKLFARIQYVILEPSAERRAWQADRLKTFADRVRWADSPRTLHSAPIHGVIFSNELLDAFPVRRHGWDAAGKAWFEWGVGWQAGQFVWAKIPNSAPPNRRPELEAVLPDGYVIEHSPAAAAWWRDAADALHSGRLLAIDYGFTTEEQWSPARPHGTLRAYARHQVSDHLLANPGEQDLTAHVNFSAIQAVGESAGLNSEAFTTQPRFLTQILARTQTAPAFGDWNAARTRQFQTLTHPEHLGRAFRVLIQQRPPGRGASGKA